jgi:DNA polymerase-3 subunit gamma/tau
MEPVRRTTKRRDPEEAGGGGSQEAGKNPGNGGAKLIVEEEVMNAAGPVARETGAGLSGSLGSLSKIRKQMASRRHTDDTDSGRALETEALYKAWRQYTELLRENRNPAVQSLELAVLRIIDGQNFEVVTSNNLEQKFIEQEKRNLSDHLQKTFANKTISFTVVIEEKTGAHEEPAGPPNKREQFRQIVEQYPLVKELKDRLRLELDY